MTTGTVTINLNEYLRLKERDEKFENIINKLQKENEEILPGLMKRLVEEKSHVVFTFFPKGHHLPVNVLIDNDRYEEYLKLDLEWRFGNLY